MLDSIDSFSEAPSYDDLQEEVAKLKQRLGYANATISDLRHAKRVRDRYIAKMKAVNRL